MEDYLQDCEVSSIELRVPSRHVPRLIEHFDGRHPKERGLATATLRGDELAFETGGARLILVLQGTHYVPRELEVLDDRAGQFFSGVVVNLVIAYGGSLRCQLRWARGRDAQRQQQVVIERGRTSFQLTHEPGRWLEAAPGSDTRTAGALRNAALGPPAPAPAPAPDESFETRLVEEALAKLQEAEQHWAEYQRLKAAAAKA